MAPALLAAVDSHNHVHVVVGSNSLARARCTRSLECGAVVKIIAPDGDDVHYTLADKVKQEDRVAWIKREFQDSDLSSLGREEVGGSRIPVNVVDAPNLSTFTLLSHFSDGPLQVGVTTSGKGCKLASRIRREIAASLPHGLGQAVDRLGAMRRKIYEEDHAAELAMDPEAEDEEYGQSAAFNKLVTPEDAAAAKSRRMRWLAQICEYWPLQRLAAITDADVDQVLQSYASSDRSGVNPKALDLRRQQGRIILAGSGPGNPDLLTIATHKAIQAADLVLADKLVPEAVMNLVPRRAQVHIARKFPGNADNAQEELLRLGLEGARAGKIVLRLKQGDPFIYGRGAEEVDFFAAHGYRPVVLPGVTSALSAPLFAGIPATHRSVADEVLICTGTGRKGAAPDPPAHVATRTVVFLMALHRITALVESLVSTEKQWPRATPCAVIERASCPDQRVIRTTLEHVCAAIEEEGSRPPGLLVVGSSCEVLYKGKQKWVVEDGFKALNDLTSCATLTTTLASVAPSSLQPVLAA